MTQGRRISFLLVVTVLFLFPTLIRCEEAEEGPVSLAALVPDDARLYISFPSLGQTWKGFRTLPLYEAYCDEEVQAFIDSLDESVGKLLSGKRSDFVRGFLDLPDLFDGEAAFAVVPREGDKGESDWAVSLVADTDPEKASRFVDSNVVPFFEDIFPWGPGREDFSGSEVLVFTGPSRFLYLSFSGGRLLLSNNASLMKRILAGPADESGSLEGTRSYEAAYSRFNGSDASFLLHFPIGSFLRDKFIDVPEKERQLLSALGLSGIEAITAVLSLEDGRAIDTIWLQLSEPPRGLLKLFGDPPVEIDLARLAPDSTVLLLAGNIRFSEIYQAFLAAAKEQPDEMLGNARRAVSELEKQLGLRSLSDVVRLLGTEVVVYAALPDGGGFIPKVALAVEVLEPEQLQTNLHALCSMLAGEEPKTMTYRNRQIHYMPSTGRDMFDLSACWCLTDGYLILSYHPTILKGLVGRLDRGKRTLRNDPEFEAAWKKLPEKASAVAYADSQRLFRYLYGLVLTFVPMMGDDLPFDAAMLPSTDCVADYLSFALSGLTSDETGIVVQTDSDGYGPTSLAMYGLTAWFLWTPIEEWDRVIFEYPSCAQTQQWIHQMMERFRTDHQRYPRDLPELLEGNRTWFGAGGCSAAQRKRIDDGSHENTSREQGITMDINYVVAVKGIDPPDKFPDDWMILWDSAPRHNNGRVVLLGNGDPIWLLEEEFQKRLKEQGR